MILNGDFMKRLNKLGKMEIEYVAAFALVIIVIVVLVVAIMSSTNKSTETIDEYLDKVDTDNDGLVDAIDSEPCGPGSKPGCQKEATS